jgi:hypothetical protein
MAETSLYFGQSRPDGSMITEKEWNEFREKYIAKVFTEGSTTLRATGAWLDPTTHELITEPTYVVTCYYKKSTGVSQRIDSLRYWYKMQFNQQAVLRVDKKVKASF